MSGKFGNKKWENAAVKTGCVFVLLHEMGASVFTLEGKLSAHFLPSGVLAWIEKWECLT